MYLKNDSAVDEKNILPFFLKKYLTNSGRECRYTLHASVRGRPLATEGSGSSPLHRAWLYTSQSGLTFAGHKAVMSYCMLLNKLQGDMRRGEKTPFFMPAKNTAILGNHYGWLCRQILS